ncbi:MAG: hypothetical protein MHPSP_004647, partial [Paramarteilia canceri]
LSIVSPLVITKTIGKYDIYASVGDDITSSAIAIRNGLSLCVAALCQDKNKVELLRQAGLIFDDKRSRERKKPGRSGARERYP